MLRKFFRFFLLNSGEIGFQNYLILVLSLMITILGTIGTIINIGLGLSLALILSTAIPAFIFAILYLYSRIYRKYVITKFIITFITLLILDVQWFLNYGSYGPIIYLFVVLQSFVIIFYEKKTKLIFTLLIFADVTVLFLLEYLHPEWFGAYATPTMRLIDIYLGLIIYLVLGISLLNTGLRFYREQQEKAQIADKLKSAFLANMSHEIRTPMNGILGFADLLKNRDLPLEQQQNYIAIIEKSGERMLNLINNLIDISKIEAGLMEVDINTVVVNDLLDYIYSFFKPQVEAKGLQLKRNYGLTDPDSEIRTDREKLYAILLNLIKNALNYTEHGQIEFGYQKKDNVLEFYVSDTGSGIPTQRLEAIFERFIQADFTDKMARQGAGLGLSITKAYLQLLNGTIWVKSKPGEGSVFYFNLPYQVENRVSETVEKENETAESAFTRRIKVLIAEDDDVSAMLLEIILLELNAEIARARNGEEAIRKMEEQPDTNLILMDLKMPGLSGYEATRKIRAFNKTVYIIAQTAYGLSGDKEKALQAGCDNYIAKPINPAELRKIILEHFEG